MTTRPSVTPTVTVTAYRTGTQKTIVLATVCMVALSILLIWLRRLGHTVQEENGLMENLQAGGLFVGMIILGVAALQSRTGKRVLAAGLGLAYFSVLILEVDLRGYDLPTINAIFNGRIRDAWLGALWVAAFVWFLRRRNETWSAFLQWVWSAPGLLLLLAGVPWLSSVAIDKLRLLQPKMHRLFVEEFLEVHGVILMVASAWLTWRDTKTTK